MKPLNKAQREALKHKLIEEKRELDHHFEKPSGDDLSTALTERSGELSAYDNHPADLATETFERGRDMALDAAFVEKQDEIDQALARLENGSYGSCEICGDPIPFERLEAIPSTTTCLKDAAATAVDDSQRPIEEQVMTPPPAGAGEGRQGNAGRFDDADAWKLAESHGNSDSPAMAAFRDVDSYEQLSTDKANEAGKDEELSTRQQ